MLNRSVLLFCSFFAALAGISQDFNHYNTLHSKGGIPSDIVTPTLEKIAADKGSKKGDLSSTQEKIFLEQIHYNVDELLKSGMVVYGDSVTAYVQHVAGKLLSSEKDLFAKLRFYTYKSNSANAFSTDQGIIFVTTGLISQLSSEAELAYVLAHEIAHYQLHHVVQSYQFENSPRNQTISRLSIYSKEKELEADKTALDLYHKAGYSSDELITTFDVMMYSYLPFDEVEVPKTYYNDSLLYIPASAFPDKKFPIKKKEDYNDAASSHPNIRKRKEAVEENVANFSNWGDKSFLLSESEFVNVRNIARFESVRADLIEADFTSVLYDVFLLEREFPDSYYLQKMKALAWLGLAQFKAAGKSGFPTTYREGEIASYYSFLHSLSAQQVMTLAVREIYDFQKRFPQEDEAKDIYDYLIRCVAQSPKFKLNTYSRRTYAEAASHINDTTAVTEKQPAPAAGTSKYDKIRSSREENPDKASKVFDSTQFHLYALTDVVADPYFTERFGYWEKQDSKTTQDMSVTNAILFAPEVEYEVKGKVARQKSQQLSVKLSEKTREVAEKAGGEILVLDDASLGVNGTDEFNERSVLVSNLLQSVNYEDILFYPVNKAGLHRIASSEGKENALFVYVKRYYSPDFSGPVFFLAATVVAIPWLVLDYIPMKLSSANKVRLSIIAFNLDSGLPVNAGSSVYTEKLTPVTYGAHMYRLFHNEKTY